VRAGFSQSIFLVLLLLTFALSSSSQIIRDPRSAQSEYPVKPVSTHTPTVADIHFEAFEFNWLTNSRYGPMPWQITGQPSKNTYYYVEPKVYGEDAIATMKFEAVDEHGALISVIPILQKTGAGGRPDFLGMMLTPDRPFRVVVSGQAVDGKSYRIVHPSLFVPSDVPEKWDPEMLKRMEGAGVKNKIAWLEDKMRQDYLTVKQEFEKLKDGTIVMPRTRVFNVNYVPLLSSSGQPLGLRITYEATFSQTGYYNPQLQVFFDYKILEWRGVVDWYALNSSIEPAPKEESPQVRGHPLAYGAGYTYLANTIYRFKLDLVPVYVIRDEQSKYCLDNQRFKHDPLVRARWEAIRASKEWVSLRILIHNSGFDGVIENFYPQQMIYNTYLANGARECAPKRF